MNGYSKKAWFKLDNAAKIYPSTSSKSDTRVFRFSCELLDFVKGEILQASLEAAIEDLPEFRYVLKRGMFWYYLEQSSLCPVARPEEAPPCSAIYNGSKTLLFNVTWYKKRINLEVYHVLADGTGALHFFKTLVLYYLKFAHPDTVGKVSISDIIYDASQTQKMTDAFNKYYFKNKPLPLKQKNIRAYQIKGARETEWRLNIIEGSVSAKAIIEKAHEYGATVTAFVTALFIRSIYGEMNAYEKSRPVVVNIPVNLRNFFESKSTRNFFGIVEIKYDFSDGKDSLEDIITHSKQSLAEHLNEEYLQNRLNKFLGYERNFFIRLVPLAIKNLYMHIAYSFSRREFTSTVSNLGKIEMPEAAKPYIKLFDVFNSTEKMQICICSYEDKMNISFSSPFLCTDIQRNFFRALVLMGIPVEISANDLKGTK